MDLQTRETSPGEQIWQFQARDSVTSSPTVVDGTVFVGSSDDNLYAIDAETGEQIWQFQTRDEVFSSPAVADSMVFIGDDYGGNLYAIDAEAGEQIWQFQTEDYVYHSPTVVDGTVFIGDSYDMYAIDAETGEQIWQFQARDYFSSDLTVVDGTVFVGGGDDNVYAVDAETGEQIWQFQTGNVVASPPTVANGTVFVGSDDDNVYAVDAETGEQIWQFQTGDIVWSSPTVADGTVFVGSFDENLYAIDAETGEQIWQFQTRDEVYSSPTVVDGTVFIGGSYGDIYAVDAETSEQIWQFQTGNVVASSPTVVDGTVFVGNNDGNVYAIDAGVSGSSEGSRVRHRTLGHHDKSPWNDSNTSVDEPTETPTPTATPTQTPTPTPTPTLTTTEYDFSEAATQQQVSVGERNLLVLRGVPDADDLSRFAVTTPEYELVGTDLARAALITFWYGERTFHFDWESKLSYARSMVDSYRQTELVTRATSFGWEALEAYAMYALAPTAAIGATLDLLNESVAWAVAEIADPYMETMSKLRYSTGPYGEMRKQLRQSDRLLDLPEQAFGFLNAADAVWGAYSGWSGAVSAATSAYAASGSATTALSSAGKGAASTGVYFAAIGLAADAVTDLITVGMKQNAELSAIGHAYTLTRIPIIERIRTLHERASAYELSPANAFELSYLTTNHHYMSAVANDGMYTHAHAVEQSSVGFAWDGLTGIAEAATALEDRAMNYRRAGAAAHAEAGQWMETATQRANASFNAEAFGRVTSLPEGSA